MTRPYPIGWHRGLKPLRGRRSIVAGAGEVLVWRDRVVTAVDVRIDVPVVVGRPVPAVEPGWYFQAIVSYRCTVVDPDAVVEARSTPAIHDLRRFLARDLDAARLDRFHVVGDETGVHRTLTAFVAERRTHDTVPGVRVRVARVGVELAVYVDPTPYTYPRSDPGLGFGEEPDVSEDIGEA